MTPFRKNLDELRANIIIKHFEIKSRNNRRLNFYFLNFEKSLKLVIDAPGGHIQDKYITFDLIYLFTSLQNGILLLKITIKIKDFIYI